jgi:hypothetical protein
VATRSNDLGVPLAKFQTFVNTLLPSMRHRHLFRDVRAYVLFIGHNRSGSSLVGSLLNAHRHALIAHELNALHYLKRNFTCGQIFWLLYQQDLAFEKRGRNWTGYDYRVPGQWQGRFEQLQVVGDKHAGGATQLLGTRPELLERLQRTVRVPVKCLHVVRNPLDNIATIHRREGLPLRAAAERYFRGSETNWRIVQALGAQAHTVHLEELVEQPRKKLLELCEFLALNADADYLTHCASSVFTSPRQTRDEIVWPADLSRDLLWHCISISFLQRYCFEINAFIRGAKTSRTALGRAQAA